MAYGLTQSADLERSSSQHFSVGDSALLAGNSAFAIEASVNLESVIGGGAAAYVIAAKRVAGGSRSYVFKVGNDGSGNISISLQASSSGAGFDRDTSVTWTPTPSNSFWYHLGVSWNSGTVQYSVEGVQMGTDQAAGGTSVATVASSFFIGNEAGSGDNFDGKISLLRFWQAARTPAQFFENKCKVLGPTANLSGEWTLNNVLTDNSGNGFTLTNVNSTPFVTDVPSVCVLRPSFRPNNMRPALFAPGLAR